PDYAGALTTLATIRNSRGNVRGAISECTEAVGLWRHCVKEHPDAFLGELAMALLELGTLLKDLGELKESLRVLEECVEIRRRQVRWRPELFRHELARALVNLSAVLAQQGTAPTTALLDEAVELCRGSEARTMSEGRIMLMTSLLNRAARRSSL